MNLTTLWEKSQADIKEKVGETSYDTWFSLLEAKQKNDNTLVLETPDDFYKNWIVEHYEAFLTDIVNTDPDKPINLEILVNNQLVKKTENKRPPVEEAVVTSAPRSKVTLNTRFTFDNFVVGPSNRFSSAACLAVAESPAKAYNPLFVYGQVGLGKTHLIQAITHKIGEIHPELKICYLTSERFTNELIESIQNRSTGAFRNKYRNIDVLLIDDIHFIAGKESTQEEFFHTFNFLHDNRKQIIITSDRPPKEISKLEERLSSRFAWGLITDVQPPNFETRVAILRKKVKSSGANVPDDIVLYIAEQIKTNIRELEGALIRVAAFSQLEDKPMSLDMAKVVLRDMVRESSKTISVEMVQKTVSRHFQMSLVDLRSKKRNKNIVQARQIAMYLSRKLCKMSLPEIGNAFGGKDHTTVLHSCNKIEAELDTCENMKDVIMALSTDLKK